MAGSISRNAGDYLNEMQRITGLLDAAVIDTYCNEIFKAWDEGRTVFVMGNGGSASCASHHATDYVKTARVEGERALRAISLVDNIGMLTAVGNDISYDDIFHYPLEAMSQPGDIAVAISCSGNSPNVVKALAWAKANGLLTVAITGFDGGKIGKIASMHINIPSDNYGVIEDLQLSIGHIAAPALKARVEQRSGVRA